ncbi:uncharacterized protein N7483_011770 [Penicillium malachiteum]|uniref:uncharacterized protein n=1 Tax=Penicillium malachiteum TaxID=1324776 RepID=UPI002547A22F|nr:uncharacterized protein N7483_011770 [Penicillium malachiteum]KAJ5714589.1 hypothetical protein N7483_011770 [Penicillium malachiteum]
MRLFLSAGIVRRVRIILLRATHLPFVLMIWVYESSRPHSRHLTSRSPSLMTGGRQSNSASSAGAPRCQDPLHPSVVETNRRSAVHDQNNVDRHDAHEPNLVRPGQAQLTDVIDAVERLRVQVERVTMALTAQERGK